MTNLHTTSHGTTREVDAAEIWEWRDMCFFISNCKR